MATTLTANIDVVESTGSDVYAHFNIEAGQATTSELAELAADSGAADTLEGGMTIVARLDAASKIKEGEQSSLWFDTSQVHLFDPKSGRNLLVPAA